MLQDLLVADPTFLKGSVKLGQAGTQRLAFYFSDHCSPLPYLFPSGSFSFRASHVHSLFLSISCQLLHFDTSHSSVYLFFSRVSFVLHTAFRSYA
jgi:hypothetical protein